MNIKNIIGENIRTIREFKGYSQDYMAMQLEMTQPGYSKLESGSSTISIDKLAGIAKILEVEITDLFLDKQRSIYIMNNKHISNAYIENNYSEHKDVYEKLKLINEKLNLINEKLDLTSK